MTDSGYINEDIFLELLQHLQKHRSPRKCLPMFNGHASHDSLKWATAEKMSLKCYAYLLTWHTPYSFSTELYSNPLRRSVIKEETNFMHYHTNATITKFRFEELFSATWHKEQQSSMLPISLSEDACFLPSLTLFRKTNFCHSYYFTKLQPTSITKYFRSNLKFKVNRITTSPVDLIWGCIQTFMDWVHNEIYAYNSKHALTGNTNGYGGKNH